MRYSRHSQAGEYVGEVGAKEKMSICFIGRVINLQYFGDEGEAIGDVGEYLGDDGDICAGAIVIFSIQIIYSEA